MSAQLAAIAGQMAGYRDLPMGRHDDRKLSSPEAIAAFEAYVRSERELLSLLTRSVSDHETMLTQMR